MYVAQFQDGDGQAWVQGLIRLATPVRGLPSAALDEILGILGRQARIIADLRDSHVSVRVVVCANGRVERIVLIMAPAVREMLVRRALGSFLALERITDDACDVPLDRDGYDEWLLAFPERRSRLSLPSQSAGDNAWLTCGFRIAPILGELVEQAVGLGLGFGYQAQISPFSASPAQTRAVRYNLLDLRDSQGAPAVLVAEHERLSDALDRATRLVGETLAVADTASAQWLRDAIDRRFERSHGNLRIVGPALPFDGTAELGLAMHDAVAGDGSDPTLDADEICREAADDTVLDALIAWHPPASPSAPSFEPPPSPPGEDGRGRETPADMPEPYEGDRPFAFISYKHDDAPRFLPALRDLDLPVWYDRGIHGGTEWDAVLEDRIRACSALIAFMSPGAVASKYCRREIKFADTIDIPILGVMLEPTELRHGLAMLFQQYQTLSIGGGDFRRQLERALRALI